MDNRWNQTCWIHTSNIKLLFLTRTLRNTAITTRAIFQDERIEELSLAGDTDVSSERKNIKNVEATHSQTRRIRSMLRNHRGTGVIQVNTVDPVTKAVKIDTKKRASNRRTSGIFQNYLCMLMIKLYGTLLCSMILATLAINL